MQIFRRLKLVSVRFRGDLLLLRNIALLLKPY